MGAVSVYNMERQKVAELEIPSSFGEKVRWGTIHQAVTAQLWNRRQGTAKVKNRHEVSGSTRKIYRQKGTGRARHGDIKAPLFVGGGRAFGPKPRDYEIRLPQKIRREALRSAVLERMKENRLWVLSDLDLPAPKTKLAAALFSRFEIPSALVVLEGARPAVERSVRNLEKFRVCRLEGLSLVDLLRYDHLVMTREAFEKVTNSGVSS